MAATLSMGGGTFSYDTPGGASTQSFTTTSIAVGWPYPNVTTRYRVTSAAYDPTGKFVDAWGRAVGSAAIATSTAPSIDATRNGRG